MGRLTRPAGPARLLGALLISSAVMAGWHPSAALGFTGFGATSADATYGVSMTFRVELEGGPPDRLELLLRFGGEEGVFVAPVQPSGDSAEYVWDTADRHVTPNTRVSYAWRATDGGEERVSLEGTLLYDDDRPGLDWQSARLGEATVHWYGTAEPIARGLGELAADGAANAEALLGHEMTGAVDIFVYDSQEDFFGALGPGAREWTGAATYPALRTIFMSLTAGDQAYRQRTLVHEVTHVVFNDATDNAFHEPAKWLNEGLASWAESQSAAEERSEVEFEASNGGLFAFEAIAEQFPIGERGARLAYAQGATMVDMIVAEHGPEAIAEIADAYRGGASDDEALEAGTGQAAEELFAAFYAEFGVEPPQPIEPASILPSVVRKPGGAGGGLNGGPQPAATPTPDGGDPAARDEQVPWLALIAVLGGVAAVLGVAWAASRRQAPGAED